LNPHLTIGSGGGREMGGAVGQAIDVPWAWAPGLKAAGFDVRQDLGAGPNSVAAGMFVSAAGTPFEGLPEIVGGTPFEGLPEIVGGFSSGARSYGRRRDVRRYGLTPLPMAMPHGGLAGELAGAMDAESARTVAWSLRNNRDPAHLEGLAAVVQSPLAKASLLRRAQQLRTGR
jgi:hypothetical protein